VFVSSPLWLANTRLKLQGVTVGMNARSQWPKHTGIVGMSVSCLHNLLLTVILVTY